MNNDFYVFVSCGLQKATLAERLAVPRMVGIVERDRQRERERENVLKSR